MSNGRTWSPSDTATLRRMAGSGASDAEIASHMGRCAALVCRKRREAGIERGVSPALASMMSRISARRRRERHDGEG